LFATMRVNFGHLVAVMAQYSAPTWATLVAGLFMLLALSLSTYLIFEHLSAYNNPEEQKFVLGVILMVPCYAIESVRALNVLYMCCIINLKKIMCCITPAQFVMIFFFLG